jgi:hypothetical protein
MEKNKLTEFVRLVVEQKIREAEIGEGEKVEWGSDEHIRSLKTRIYDMSWWRDKSIRGSETRANYSRLVKQLRNTLKSAERAALKRKVQSSTEG